MVFVYFYSRIFSTVDSQGLFVNLSPNAMKISCKLNVGILFKTTKKQRADVRYYWIY